MNDQKNDFKSELDRQIARETGDRWFTFFKYSQERQNFSSDNFRTLEIQIASIIFALISIFFSKIIIGENIVVKVLFIIDLFFLTFSLMFGLINEHILSKFWDRAAEKYKIISGKWFDARKGNISNIEAKEFESGVCLNKE